MNSSDQLSLVLECFFFFLGGGRGLQCKIILARWAPYLINAYKWPYKWETGVITCYNGVIALRISGDLFGDDIVTDKFRILIMGTEFHVSLVHGID